MLIDDEEQVVARALAGRRPPVTGPDGWGRGSLADWPDLHLEGALSAYVARLGRRRLEPTRLEALLDRLGLRGRPPLTLAEAGRVAGVSGERVRQLEARLRKQHATCGAAPLPQLDAALAAVGRMVPLPASQVPEVLRERGLAAGPFSAESLLAAARLLGQRVPFAVSGVGDDAVFLPATAAIAGAHADVVEVRARRLVERTGASTLAALADELAGEGIRVCPEELRVVLEACTNAVVRADGWFWFSEPEADGAFVRASRRMLAVTSPLSLASLHDGLSRHFSFRRRPDPPPLPVLAAVYGDHPEFEVDADLVSPAAPLDADLLGSVNRCIVDILRAAPGGMLGRAPLLEACHRAGLNLTSVNLYTTYSECLERVRPGVFAARGTVTGASVPPAPRRITPRRRGPRSATCGWTADGRPWLSAPVSAGTSANGVIHVPAEIRPAVAGRRFNCTAGGEEITAVAVDDHGNSWGWSRFIRQAGATPGDVVRAVFDLEAGTAEIEVLCRQR